MGDFNTAHREIDLARPRDNKATSGFTEPEREELDRWLRSGWIDTFRHHHPTREGAYSWWSQRVGVRARNIGWRLDLVLASPGVEPYLRDAFIRSEVMGSDHCPVGVRLSRAVVDDDVVTRAAPATRRRASRSSSASARAPARKSSPAR
jgi:exodeoxyribonuclease-3